ncbi:MAG: hypothetical protein JEZ12_26600 [Desulfobacterium sp.]|nr:hypothetical protein [Desulfobacterium sp.]
MVRVDHDALLQPGGADFEISEVGTTIEALFSEVGTPKRGSAFEVDGEVYRVERVQDNNRIFVKVVVNED